MTGLPARPADRGSVTPLVIGMTLCLLLLAAGVTAAGSAVLARRNLQSACDGAADAVAGRLAPGQLATGAAAPIADLLADALSARMPGAVAAVSTTDSALVARCATDAPVVFGVLFGSPTAHIEVDTVSRVHRS